MKVFHSFRDPQGRVVFTGKEVWRLIENGALTDLNEFLKQNFVEQWRLSGRIVRTVAADKSEIESFTRKFSEHAVSDSKFDLYKHERIDFPSYPYEWSPEMLYEAATLTLEIADFSLTEGWGIKDATPFNVLFEGTEPVFIDILSFEKRDEKDYLWLPYNQFVQTFLLPLLVNKEIGLPLQTIFLANRDGLAVSEVTRFFGILKQLKPEILSLVTLPGLLSKRAEGDAGLYEKKLLDSPEKARFILKQSLRRLRKQLAKAAPRSVYKSKWTEYTKYNQENIPDYMDAKQRFVTDSINTLKPLKVLDVGCNTGIFSLIAARAGAAVVAVDSDPAVVGRVFRVAKQENANVLPLVVNLARPTPRLGWRYSEIPSFLDRAAGHFDLVLMLAVLHHLLVQERISLREILRLAADLTRDALIIEFVPPDDKLFKRLTRGRDSLHQDLTTDNFDKTAAEFFTVITSIRLPETERRLYLMKKK